MAYTYYNSKADGTINEQITSGQLGALLTPLTVAERANGDDELTKVWITSDEDATVYVGIDMYTAYTNNIFISANEDDAVGDLTGTEGRMGALKVVSCTETELIVLEDEFDLAMEGDVLSINYKPYTIDTLTDNGDGTLTIVATIDYVLPLAVDGDFVTTVIPLNLVTATPKPFWHERKVTAGSAWSGADITTRLMIGK